MELSITTAEPTQYAILAEIHDRCFDPAWGRDSMAEVFDTSCALGLIARLGGVVAGFALSRRVVDESELLALGILPRWRQRGIARALLEATIAAAAEDGADTIFLEVAEDNAAGRALYDGFGFIAVGRRADYYRRRGAEPCAALVLRKEIKPS